MQGEAKQERDNLKRQMKKVGFHEAVEILGDSAITGESIAKELKKPGPTPAD